MTNVTLKELRFALPMVIKKSEIENSAEDFICSTEIPQEFFGLTDKEQVAIISGLITTVLSFDKKQEIEASSKLLQKVIFPLHIGIGMTVKKTPNISIETQFTFPDCWAHIPRTVTSKVITSIAYLLQSTAVSIVSRAGQQE
jgi:hypothetical protein